MTRAFLLALAAALPAAAQSIAIETVGDEAFSLPRLAKLAREKLETLPGPLVRVTMFGQAPSPVFLTQSPLESFGVWLGWWKRAARGRWRVAEAIAIGPDASLRVRMGRSTTRLGLKGQDPLTLWEGGRRYEILHVSSPGPGRATVYVRGSRPLPCGEVLDRLRARTGLRLRVRMRTDAWFIGDAGFPPFYWFQNTEPPTREAIAAGASADCGE